MLDEIKQNTNAWHLERNKGIGASESPIILGLSPYKTALELYEQKISTIPSENSSSFITDKGHRLEPIARSKYEFHVGHSFPDSLAVHRDYPFIRASFDGYNSELNKSIEIKYVGKKAFENIKDKETLIKYYPHYYCQIQHQMMITGNNSDLVMINDDMNIKIIPFDIDPDYILDMVPKLIAFWGHVQNKIPPSISKDDILTLDRSKQKLLSKYKKLKSKVDTIETEMENIRKELLDGLLTNTYTSSVGKIIYSERKGSVDYGKIKELKNIDLDQYRKPTTFSWMIK